MVTKPAYEIDGNDFSTLEEFYEIFSLVLIPGAYWGRNLDAFNDIMRGGFGTPDGGFLLLWKNSSRSREALGYEETVRQLEYRLQRCHPSARASVKDQLSDARKQVGPTVFDWLVEIILSHGEGGLEASSGVELRLE